MAEKKWKPGEVIGYRSSMIYAVVTTCTDTPNLYQVTLGVMNDRNSEAMKNQGRVLASIEFCDGVYTAKFADNVPWGGGSYSSTSFISVETCLKGYVRDYFEKGLK